MVGTDSAGEGSPRLEIKREKQYRKSLNPCSLFSFSFFPIPHPHRPLKTPHAPLYKYTHLTGALPPLPLSSFSIYIYIYRPSPSSTILISAPAAAAAGGLIAAAGASRSWPAARGTCAAPGGSPPGTPAAARESKRERNECIVIFFRMRAGRCRMHALAAAMTPFP